MALIYQDEQGRIVERSHLADYNACRDDSSVGCYVTDWQEPKVVFEMSPGSDLDYARFDAVKSGYGVLSAVATIDNRIVTQRAIEVPSTPPGQTEWSLEPAEEIPLASIKATHRPIVQILGGIRYVFFWGTDDLLWQATRSGPSGPWTVAHVRVVDGASPISHRRTVPLASNLPIDPAAAIGRPPSDPVNAERLYLAVKTTLGVIPPIGEDWTNAVYLLEHLSGTTWLVPGFAPIRIPQYDPPPLNNLSNYTIPVPRHNMALAYVANDHSIPAFPGDVDLSEGGRLVLAYTKGESVDEEWKDEVVLIQTHPVDFAIWTGSTPSSPFSRRLAKWVSLPEPGGRSGLSILSEPGWDANPRVAAKVAPGLDELALYVSPFGDGIRELQLYDNNDWWVMRDGLCWKMIQRRCPTVDCIVDDSDVGSYCGQSGPYPEGFPAPARFDDGGDLCNAP